MWMKSMCILWLIVLRFHWFKCVEILTYLLSLSTADIRANVEWFSRIQLKQCSGCLVHKKVILMHYMYDIHAVGTHAHIHIHIIQSVHNTQHDFKLHLTFNFCIVYTVPESQTHTHTQSSTTKSLDIIFDM